MENERDMKQIVELSVKVGTVILLLLLCLKVITPIFLIVLWGAIIAVGTFPAYERVNKALKNKRKLSAVIVTLSIYLIIILPLTFFVISIGQNAENISNWLTSGGFKVPPANEKIINIPIVGQNIYDLWELGNTNIKGLISILLPHTKGLATGIVPFVTKLLFGLSKIVISVMVAGIFFVFGETAKVVSDNVSRVLIGDYIKDFTKLSVVTIRSVVQGIIGVGVIQGIAAGVGLRLANVPGAGILTLLTVFVCVVQMPPMLILVPVAIYLFYKSTLTVAIIFSIWVLIITFGDTPLRALMFGRGTEVPSVVIFIGTIGGALNWGILGLFIGAIIAALGYKFITTLIEDNKLKG